MNLNNYPTLSVIFARIIVVTLHSADVEMTSEKTHDRSALYLSTESLYFYIYFNMPTLNKFDPRPAIVKCDAKAEETRTV